MAVLFYYSSISLSSKSFSVSIIFVRIVSFDSFKMHDWWCALIWRWHPRIVPETLIVLTIILYVSAWHCLFWIRPTIKSSRPIPSGPLARFETRDKGQHTAQLKQLWSSTRHQCHVCPTVQVSSKRYQNQVLTKTTLTWYAYWHTEPSPAHPKSVAPPCAGLRGSLHLTVMSRGASRPTWSARVGRLDSWSGPFYSLGVVC